MRKSPVLIGSLVVLATQLFAQEYQGAESILRQLREQSAVAAAPKSASPVTELRQKIAAFQAESSSLTPAEAATRWLNLFDAFSALPADAMRTRWQNTISMETLIRALPPASAWEALASELDRRIGTSQRLTDHVLHLLTATLRADAAGRKKAFEDLSQSVASTQISASRRKALRQSVDAVEEAMAKFTGQKEEELAAFEKRLTAIEKETERRQSLKVPDLLQLTTPTKASEFLLRALALGSRLSISNKDTRRLAAKLALQEVGKLKQPRWELVSEVEDAPLYEALVKKFPPTESEDARERSAAETVYWFSLISTGRTAEAASLVLAQRAEMIGERSELDSTLTDALVRSGHGKELMTFYREVLAKDPEIPFWSELIDLAARLNESAGVLTFLREVAARPDPTPEARQATDEHYAKALLAADEVEEGVKVLRLLISRGPKAAPLASKDWAEALRKQYAKAGIKITEQYLAAYSERLAGRKTSGLKVHVKHCLWLAQLGVLLKKPDLVAEGLAKAHEILATANVRDHDREETTRDLLEFCVKNGRGVEAEAIVLAELLRINNPAGNSDYSSASDAEDWLIDLVAIYARAGRSKDILALLDTAPNWGAPDLKQLSESSSTDGYPLLYLVGKALHDVGRKAEALAVTERSLESQTDFDPAYELLLALAGNDAQAKLDGLLQRDRFEERPMIWKAQLALNAGNLEDAEKFARQAIAIDPSDGGTRQGDRLRAYAILGATLEKKGDAEQAALMKAAVAAIRLSESADDLWSAGLLSRAVAIYESALQQFEQAYCIQSRLALRYNELGNFPKAEEHYRRAFELMPESFGRIESHCFGCEGAFTGSRAQGIADRVFTELATKMPDKPQVFYLLGYLRDAQGRHAEALESFRQAVKLDPDYFNAWEHLQESAKRMQLPSPDAEEASFALLRLDPALTHHRADFDEVRDLRKLWDAVLTLEKTVPVASQKNIYPLAASKAELERRQLAAKAVSGNSDEEDEDSADRSWGNDSHNLRAAFSEHPLLKVIAAVYSRVSSAEE